VARREKDSKRVVGRNGPFRAPRVLASRSPLMMEEARTSETLVNFYQTTRRYNPEDSHLRTQILFSFTVLQMNKIPNQTHNYTTHCVKIEYTLRRTLTLGLPYFNNSGIGD
jgi:hypothetical protein